MKKGIHEIKEQKKEIDFSYEKNQIPTLFHIKIRILAGLKSKWGKQTIKVFTEM